MAPIALTEAREFAPAEGVDVMVEALRFELAMLEESVRRAEAEADDLERLVDAASPSRREGSGALLWLTSFLDQFGSDATLKRLERLTCARQEATARVTEAQVEAERIRRAGLLGDPESALPMNQNLELVAAGPVDATVAEPAAAGSVDVAGVQPERADLAGSDLAAVPGSGVAGIGGEEPSEVAPVEPGAMAAAAAVAGSEPPVPPAQSVEQVAFMGGASLEEEVGGIHVTGLAPAVNAELSEQAFVDFWNAQSEAERDRWWTAIPIDALLPMLALVGVLVVVLARIA